MKGGLELVVAPAGSDLVVAAKGEIDMESSPRLLAEIRRALKQAPSLLVDLAEVTYIDSSGIAVLVQGLRAAVRERRQFALRRPSPKVLAVLDLADLQGLFRIEAGPAAGP